MIQIKQWWLPWTFFAGAVCLITFPWFLKPGFIFLLDFVWAPSLPMPTESVGHISSLPWQWLWWLLAQIFSTSVVQRGAFALPWLLAGVSMYHLAAWIITKHIKTTALVTITAALSAGVFYLTNSFVFTRTVMGQYYLLLAYALTPWALLMWLKFIRSPQSKLGLAAGLTVTAVMLTNVHHLILLPLLLIFFIHRPQREKLGAWLSFLSPLAILFAFTLLAKQTTPTDVTGLNPLGPWARALQAPQSGNLILDTLTLTATWKIDLPFLFPYESLPGFGLVMAALLLIMLVGVIYYHQQKPLASLINRLLLLIIVSSLLTIGVAHPTIEPFAAWLYQNVPGWIGLRDSAKFLSLLAVGEAMLIALGTTAIYAIAKHRLYHAAIITTTATLLLTLYLSSPNLWGLGQQVYPLPYPSGWNTWNEHLSTMKNKPRVLFLPWHQYVPFTFTADRTVINPAPGFFTNANIISGDNSEVGGAAGRPFIYSESTRALSKKLEIILADAPTQTNMGNELAPHKIQFIMLATDTWDANRYQYLYQQQDFTLVFESDELVVWENQALY